MNLLFKKNQNPEQIFLFFVLFCFVLVCLGFFCFLFVWFFVAFFVFFRTLSMFLKIPLLNTGCPRGVMV